MNKKSTLWLIALCVFCEVITVKGSQLNCVYTKSGYFFNDNDIISVSEDSKGFLWLCSSSEIARYDGAKFVNTDTLTINTILANDNQIQSLKVINGDRIAVCTRNGLYIYEIPLRKVKKIECFNDIETLSIVQDSSNLIWVNTINGLYLYSPEENRKRMITQPLDKNYHNFKNAFLSIGNDGKLFYSGRNATIVIDRQNPIQQGLFDSDNVFKTDTLLKFGISTKLIVDQWGYAWIWSRENLSVRKMNSDLTLDNEIYRLKNTEISAIYHDGAGITWIGLRAKGNLRISRSETGEIMEEQFISISDQNDDMHNTTNQFLMHSGKSVFIATRNGVFELLVPRNPAFKQIKSGSSENTITHNTVSGLFIDDNVVWVGTSLGLNKVEFKNISENHFKVDQFLDTRDEIDRIQDNKIESIAKDDNGNLWIGTKGKITLFDPLNRRFFDNRELLDQINSNYSFARCIYRQSNGNIWLGFESGGVVYFDKSTDKMVVPELIIDGSRLRNCTSIAIDHQNYVWTGTKNRGIISFKMAGEFVTELEQKTINNFENSGISITKLYVDKSNNVWAASSKGLFLLDRENNCFNLIPMPGETSNYFSGITEDVYGNLWISTLKGICKYNLANRSSYYYEINNDGFARADYVFNSTINSSGIIFLGGIDGLIYFTPESVREDSTHYNLLFTDFSIFTTRTKSGVKSLGANINYSDKVELSHKDYQFSIEFTALAFSESDKIKYRYKLEGFDKDWLYTGQDRKYVSYNNLVPGEYRFTVQSTNASGIWINNTVSIDIEVLPSPYLTWWSKLLYLLIFGMILFFMYKAWHKWTSLKNRDDINRWRMKFYTSVSYGFKTPITLMQGPLNNLIENYGKLSYEENMDMLRIIHRNCKRLVKQVDELIEFNKIDDHKTSLRITETDIIPIIQNICDSLKGLCDARGVNLNFITNTGSVSLLFDVEKMVTVLLNLISNAIKNSDKGGNVTVECKVDSAMYVFWIKVSDVLYRESKNNKNIIHHFRKQPGPSNEDYGQQISMALTHDYIEMHKGSIVFEPTGSNKGRFRFSLLLGESHFKELLQYSEKNTEKQPDKLFAREIISNQTVDVLISDNKSAKNDLPVVAVISNDTETLYFISKILSNSYNIKEYNDYLSFTYHAESDKISLVAIDATQDHKVEVSAQCAEIRQNEAFSHISIVVIGEDTGENEKQYMYSSGADAYISKPYNAVYLQLRINQLMKSRWQIINKTRKELITTPKHLNIKSLDEKLLVKVMEYIESNIGDENLFIDNVATSMGISKSMLYRKIKMLTGKSPVELIRSVRLKRAAQLLENNTFTIAEVAYMVGFSDTRYFSTCFKKEHNLTPSQYKTKVEEKVQ